jgi:2-amino-4-hydroxy-6-hydroxymethyldihydropteridine diphosphokinase
MKAYFCLGANLGDPEAQIRKAVRLLNADYRIQVLRKSSLIKTKPYGKTDQPDFWNQVVEVETDYLPQELINIILQTESNLGRVRGEKWGPRLIDIDILMYEDLVLESKRLSLPHPDFHNRLFALELLAELAPDLRHPILHKSISALLNELGGMEK